MTAVNLKNASLSQIDVTHSVAQEALSAVVDSEGLTSVVDVSDPEIRQRWTEYHLIGDAMRDPSSLTPVTQTFEARMSAALARESAHGQMLDLSTPTKMQAPSIWQRLTSMWPGMAVATALFSVVWIAQPLVGLEQGAEEPVAVQASADRSLTTAADAQGTEGIKADYVSAHRHLAGPIAPLQVVYSPGGY